MDTYKSHSICILPGVNQFCLASSLLIEISFILQIDLAVFTGTILTAEDTEVNTKQKRPAPVDITF